LQLRLKFTKLDFGCHPDQRAQPWVAWRGLHLREGMGREEKKGKGEERKREGMYPYNEFLATPVISVTWWRRGHV